jgi:hypothetical protein
MSSRRASAPDSGPISLNVVSQRGYVSVDGYRREIGQLKAELTRKNSVAEAAQKDFERREDKYQTSTRDSSSAMPGTVTSVSSTSCGPCSTPRWLQAAAPRNPRSSASVRGSIVVPMAEARELERGLPPIGSYGNVEMLQKLNTW